MVNIAPCGLEQFVFLTMAVKCFLYVLYDLFSTAVGSGASPWTHQKSGLQQEKESSLHGQSQIIAKSKEVGGHDGQITKSQDQSTC